MRFSPAVVLALIALPATAPFANAAGVPSFAGRPDAIVTTLQERQYRAQRDCTPYNGPFGFYGNVWCQPPNEQSYMRNLNATFAEVSKARKQQHRLVIERASWSSATRPGDCDQLKANTHKSALAQTTGLASRNE